VGGDSGARSGLKAWLAYSRVDTVRIPQSSAKDGGHEQRR
jgi:hypothetical protein